MRYARVNRDQEKQMRLKTVALALGLMCLGGAAACSGTSSSGAGGAAAPEQVTTLKVDNQGSLDMDVYVVRAPAGQRIRLGTATAAAVTKMVIPSDVLLGGANTSLRFIADPIGGVRPSVSSSILVTRGDEVTLQIPPR